MEGFWIDFQRFLEEFGGISGDYKHCRPNHMRSHLDVQQAIWPPLPSDDFLEVCIENVGGREGRVGIHTPSCQIEVSRATRSEDVQFTQLMAACPNLRTHFRVHAMIISIAGCRTYFDD